MSVQQHHHHITLLLTEARQLLLQISWHLRIKSCNVIHAPLFMWILKYTHALFANLWVEGWLGSCSKALDNIILDIPKSINYLSRQDKNVPLCTCGSISSKFLDKEPFFSNNTGNAKWPNTGVVGLQTKSDMEINSDATRNNIYYFPMEQTSTVSEGCK